MKTLITILLLLTGIHCLYCQPFHKKIDFDIPAYCVAMAPTVDGGYLLGGTSTADGTINNAVLINVDSNGNVRWSKFLIPPPGVLLLSLYSLIPTRDGGFAGAGYSYVDGYFDIWMVKLSTDGQIQWNQNLGNYHAEMAYSLIQTKDDGFVLMGESYNDSVGNSLATIIKLDSAGGVLWNKLIFPKNIPPGTKQNSMAISGVELSDSSLLITGTDNYSGGTPQSPYLLKLDKNGNPIWRHSIGSVDAVGWGITKTADGGTVVAGSINRPSRDAYVVKFTPDGSLEWTSVINALGSEALYSIVEREDKSLLAVGSFSDAIGVSSDSMLIIGLSPNGSLKFAKVFNGQTGYSTGYSCSNSINNGITVCGYIYNNNRHSTLLSKFDGSINNCKMRDMLVMTTEGGKIVDSAYKVLVGPPIHTIGKPTVSAATVSEINLCEVNQVRDTRKQISVSISLFPNPVSEDKPLTITFSNNNFIGQCQLILLDALGKQVYIEKKQLTAIEQTITIPTSDLPPGFYTIELLDANTFTSVWRGKVVKVK